EGRGTLVFDNNCARCHMPRLQGGRVGPDLSGVNNKTKEELLTSILNPSYAIEPHYVHYVVTTKDGEIHDGVIAGETPGAITLRGGTEGDETILRQNVANVRASTVSLMPEGLEQSMSRQDVADVIAYLRAGLEEPGAPTPAAATFRTPEEAHPGAARAGARHFTHARRV